jgi:hypothetical protein
VPEKPARIMWREAKKKSSGFNHVRISITGANDTATCILCEVQVELDVVDRTKESVALETARKHYYKHNLDKSEQEI